MLLIMAFCLLVIVEGYLLNILHNKNQSNNKTKISQSLKQQQKIDLFRGLADLAEDRGISMAAMDILGQKKQTVSDAEGEQARID